MILLTDGTITINLPPDMYWPDQSWTGVEAGSDDYSLNGSLHIDTFVKQAGRPITLQGGENFGWVTWQTVLDLVDWAKDPGKEMTITIDSTSYTVRFDYSKGDPVTHTPIFMLNPPRADDFYYITLRLIEVQP